MTPPRLAAAALLLAAAAIAGCARKTPEPPPSKAQTVTFAYPVVRPVLDYEDFMGRTEPYRLVELRSRVTGHLTAVHFKDGEDVVKGEPLFEIDRRPYAAEYDRAAAALEKARAHVETARLNYDRALVSYNKGVTGREALDIAAGEVNEAKADVGAAVAAQQIAATNLEFTRIAAPFDGRVGRRMVDPGNLVKADETLLTTVVTLDPIYAAFDIDERTVLRLRGLIRKGEITSSRETARTVGIGLAGDAEDEFPHTGQIVFRDNQIAAGTGTLRVRALLHNPWLGREPKYLLSPGQFVRVRLPIGNPREATLVPERALGSDQGRRYVFVVNAEDKVERRYVEVGPQYGEYRVVENAKVGPENRIAPTDRVVVDGLLRVRPGAAVVVKEAGPSRLPPETALTLRPETSPAPRPRTP
ncbi:MAG: efflux RND transporter periplasmic adaptor subunit [Isosphaera sp.]|nr:efflux RND transporter periplasmic adaptor subunit [Isosphaera sp.]